MKPRRRTTALILLAFSYLLAVGWLSGQASLCGCGGWALMQDLKSGLHAAAEATSSWNSWLGNSWALGSVGWAQPAAQASSLPAFELVEAPAPHLPEWRRLAGIPVIGAGELPEAPDWSDCEIAKVDAVEIVLRRLPDGQIRPHLAIDLQPQVVVVTAELERVEAPIPSVPMIAPSAGCQSSKPKPRRSVT